MEESARIFRHTGKDNIKINFIAHLTYVREQCQSLVKTATNVQVPKKGRECANYLIDYQRLKTGSDPRSWAG
jgi:hypothetical protein